jgi:hypothetical protein
MVICPKCGHKRTDKDDPLIPDYKCPSCDIVYTKYGKPYSPPPKIKQEPTAKKIKKEVVEQLKIAVSIAKRVAEKYRANSVTLPKPPKDPNKSNTKAKKLSLIESFGIVFSLIMMAILLFPNVEKITAYAIAPFDKKPEMSFSEIVSHPEKIGQHKKDLCAWSKREEIRNPSIWTSASRKSACKFAEAKKDEYEEPFRNAQANSASKVSIVHNASTESYQNTQGYKDYKKLPSTYQSPEMEAMYKQGYDARQKVENLPCKTGGTVKDCLDKKANIPAIDDAGWVTSPYKGGFEVERIMLMNNGLRLIYRWYVSPSGEVAAVNGYAIGITVDK